MIDTGEDKVTQPGLRRPVISNSAMRTACPALSILHALLA